MGEFVDHNASMRSRPIDHLELRSDQDHPPVTIGSLLGLNLRSETGKHIYFMPTIQDDLELAQEVCRDLSKTFFIPPFFFKEIGWNANSFFGGLDNPLQNPEEKSYSTFSRFLTKEVILPEDAIITKKGILPEDAIQRTKYEWQFLGFATFWRPRSQETSLEADSGLEVLLCFDLNPAIQKSISEAFQQPHLEKVEGDPFALLKVVTEVVVDQFNHALWTFQPVVRHFEQTRRDIDPFNKGDEEKRDEDFDKKRLKKLDKLRERYTGMHEVSRHVIHISETVTVASKTMLSIVAAQDAFSKENNMQGLSGSKRNGQHLLFSANLLTNFQFRAQAFVQRLENEVHLVAVQPPSGDSFNSAGILRQTRNEAINLTDTVSIMTLLFLPGTFISGFFGQSFFAQLPTSDGTVHWFVSHNLYFFFLCTAPITIIALAFYIAEIPVIKWVRDNVSQPLKKKVKGWKGTRKSKSAV